MAKCQHWYRVEPAHGTPTVRGVCKHCGAERTFPTTDDISIWDGRGVQWVGYSKRRDPEPIAEVNSW